MRPCSPPKRTIIRCLQHEQQYSHRESDERAMLAVGCRLREAEMAPCIGGHGALTGAATAKAVISIAEGAAQKRLLTPDGGGERHGEIQRDYRADRNPIRRNRQPGTHDSRSD